MQIASELASLQEIELELQRPKFPHKSEHTKFQGTKSHNADKPKAVVKKDEVKNGDVEDKLAALRSFRRANNLCFTCGEKWTGRGHKCPTHVSIHVLQEFMDAVHVEPEADYATEDEDTEADAGQVVMAVHPQPQPSKRTRTLRFTCHINQQEILILLDSGSSGTFINSDLVERCNLEQHDCDSLKFMAADGSSLLSDKVIPQLQWVVQGHSFHFDARVLSFKGYDLILGADWLEEHSPMWFHWKKKWMKFTHNNKRILLQGVKDDLTVCSQVPAYKLKGLLKRGAITHMLELQHVQSLPRQSSDPQQSVAVIEDIT